MHISLFVLGGLTAAAGFIAIAYGVPVNEFSFGNTLIVAGTIGVVGGFILIGLAATVRQLKRIAEMDALHQPAMPQPMQSADPFKQFAQVGSPVAPMAAAPSKPEPSLRVPAPPEPKVAVAPSGEGEPLDWLRPKEKAPNQGEQSLIEEIEASLSPQPMPPQSPPPLKVYYDPIFEPKAPAPAASGEPAVEIEQGSRPDSALRAAPPVEHAGQSGPTGLFDAVWPEIRPARHAETIARARKPGTAAPPRDETIARSQASARKDVTREAPAAPAEEPRPVAILKSGMIDGMAYTLYADGSIEAVLATGTVRFASIDALRFHLEKNG